ncbi:MAG TPA: hypothetical protein VGP94_12965, partial [Tepidisphaeraceae bacterium]|nr:hypothetical protein [Tepidisphaeraceae bacterium]
APWLATRRFDSLPTTAMTILTIAGIIYAASVFILFARRRIALAATAMGAGMIAIIALFYALYLPNAQFLWLPQRISSVLLENGATSPGDVINLDYREDSLAYYQGGTIREKENNYFTTTPRDRWAKWVVLTSELWRKLPADVRSHYESFATFRGLAYAKRGSIVEVIILRRIDSRP